MRRTPLSCWRTACAVLTSVVLAGCSSTTAGVAATAPERAGYDGADVALMNTGPYAVTPSRPFGTAGTDGFARNMLEAHRIAEHTVGPWQSNTTLIGRPGLLVTNLIAPYPDVDSLRRFQTLPEPMIAAAAEHAMVAAFSSLRLSGPDRLQQPEKPVTPALQAMVLTFPDPQSAAAAAADMAASDPGPPGGSDPKPVAVIGHPDARATSYAITPDSTVVHSVAVSGTAVLVEFAQSATNTFSATGRISPTALGLVQGALNIQKELMKDFVPTPADKMADLPLDASGSLLARTLTTPDNALPLIVGAWKPRAWLHFEDDPITASRLFSEAGVDWVAQRAATVYQTRNAAAAATMLDKMTLALAATPSAQPTAAVPGLPRARCFKRTDAAAPPGSPPTWLRVAWPVKCAAAADRWVFTVHSESIPDAHQRISAQYRILAGR